MNQRLSSLLDSEADRSTNMSTQTTGDPLEDAIHQEHLKRLQAEAEAQSKTRELTVAQTQFSEYLAEKATGSEEMLRIAKEIEEKLTQAMEGEGGHGREVLLSVLAEARQLCGELTSATAEARTTAEQVKAETEKMTKRSTSEADLENSGAETKRARDGESSIVDMEADGVDEGELSSVASKEGGLGAVEDKEVMLERAKYIPLRLTTEERRVLRLIEGALNVSEYTDKVDVLSWKSKTGRITAQIKDLCAILCGLTVAQNFKRGQQLMGDRDFAALSQFFQNCFEVGRRFKIMNPEKMRENYGKLIYMLMDSVDSQVKDLLGFPCVRPMKTVHSLLEEGGAEALLTDPLLPIATAEITSQGRSRPEIQRDIRRKEKARDTLARKYRNRNISEEDLLWAM